MTGNSGWRLSFVPVLAFAVTLPALVALGLWQVERGQQKRVLHDAFAAADEAVDVSAAGLHELDALPPYAMVELRGRYLSDRAFLLDNMSHAGRPGHHVLIPFRPEGAAHVVIVDLGWRPGLAQQRAEGDVARPEADRVRGRLAPFPRPGLDLSGKPEPGGEWPRVVQFPTPDELAAQLDRPVAARRLLLDPAAAGGFVREWEPPGMPPARHYAYAFQWFGLAAALIVIFVVLARPRTNGEK